MYRHAPRRVTNQQSNHTFLRTLTVHALTTVSTERTPTKERRSAFAHAAFIARVGLEITIEITTTYGGRPTMTLLLGMEAGLNQTLSL